MANSDLPLMNIGLTPDADDDDTTDIFQTKPYLKKFVKRRTETELIKWKGSQDDYKELNDVLEHYGMDKLKRMLLGGAPYLYKQNENSYAMTHAAFYSRTDIMEIILERHKNEGTPNDEAEFRHQTVYALYTVCTTNCGDIARSLLRIGTPVIPSAHLSEAAKNGSTAVLDEILNFFPDINLDTKDREGMTPLHSAVERKHIHSVQYLLNKKADPNSANNDGHNCVHLACQHAEENILYLLTTKGGDVNAREKKGKTPALVAAENGKDGCIHILAAAGANLDQRDKQGNAPLIVAAGQGHTNTVKELIINGASFDVTDNERYNALEKAILSKKDGAAAIFIRLAPQMDYIDYYRNTIEISMLKIVRYRLTETLKALLDRMVVQPDPLNATEWVVKTGYLDIDSAGKTPEDEGYERNKTFLLQCIAGLHDEEASYHGTIRLLVDKKMKRFGNVILGTKITSYVLFLLALAYSLIQGSYEPIQINYLSNPASSFRLFTVIIVVSYFLFNLVTEAAEFFRVARLTYRYLKDKKKDRKKERQRAETIEIDQVAPNDDDSDDDDDVIEDILPMPKRKYKKQSLKGKLNDFFVIRVFSNFFSDRSNYLDVLGLFTLFLYIVLRASTESTQWILATLTFLINGLRLFRLLALLPDLGPYTNIIYKILVIDVPLFLSLFIITLLIFTGSFFVSLRIPYTAEGFLNASLPTNTDRVSGVDNEVQWVFLSGLRVLLEGNVYEGQYLYRQLNWFAGSLYLGFLFLIVVVYLNVFIAQLSDRYGNVKRFAEKNFAWNRLKFIVQVERISLLSICIDFRKRYYTKEILINKEELFKYYGVHNIKGLNVKNFTEDVDVKGMLSTIQNQQVVAKQTHEIAKHASKHATEAEPPPQQQRHESEEIRVLSERIDQLLVEIRQKDALMENKLDKLTQLLMDKQ